MLYLACLLLFLYSVVPYSLLQKGDAASTASQAVSTRSHFYWSLMANFDWQKGYAMQSGLVAVDRSTQ